MAGPARLLTELPPGPDPPRRIHAIVEIPRGSRNKYEYDPVLGVFRLDRVLYSAVHYAAAYGFVPGTLGGDGDPLDVLLLTSEPTFTGCLVECRPLGVLLMHDEEGHVTTMGWEERSSAEECIERAIRRFGSEL